MGYQRSTLKLVFEDPQFKGLEVRMRRLPIGDLFGVTELAELDEKDPVAMKQQFYHLTNMVGAGLLSWNLEDDQGQPIPATAEGLRSQDIEFVMGIVTAWTEAASSVRPPLSRHSNSGRLPPERFELMENVLESQLS